MNQAAHLLKTLKQLLKNRCITYADVAKKLEVSEVSIKRMFDSTAQNVSLERMEQICMLANIDLLELARLTEDGQSRIQHLSKQLEHEFVSDIRLLLIAVCALNHWPFKDIIKTYKINETEGIQLLAKLDRLKIIDLLAENRIRIKVARDFHWLPNGPVSNFFRKHVQHDFLQKIMVFQNLPYQRSSSM